jgi:hypothetical protein
MEQPKPRETLHDITQRILAEGRAYLDAVPDDGMRPGETLRECDERIWRACIARAKAWVHGPQRDTLSPYLGVYGSPSIGTIEGLSYCPKLQLDTDGVLLAGCVAIAGDALDEESAPVREVFHVRTHPLVIVVTDLDVYVMTSEEYACQV